jgi:hypothetical protein
LEEFGTAHVSVGELVGLRDHDYGAQVVRIEAYSVKCDPNVLRCLEHEEMGWFSRQEIAELPLAPADEFLVPILMGAGCL